jgi:lipopolysaccharide export system protein LptA
MRKLTLIVATFILLVGAFTVYFASQAKFGFSSEGKEPADQFPESGLNSSQIFKPGSGAWSKQFDKLGNLYYQFKCQYYDPQPDDTVKVTSPVIQFFMSGGQMMQIEGKNGIIRFAEGTDKGVLSNSPTEPPRYGSLRDVVVKLFSSAAQQNQNNVDMTMTMTNAQFDNDTYRLFTQEYVDEKGKVWHEDEVPVTVSARDYAFTGSGLVLYWNDLDKRLRSLQIAHGKDLILYDAGDLSPKTASPVRAASPIAAPAPQVGVPAPTTTSSTPEPQQRYTATFYDHVRVIQAGEDVVKADRMDVDFAPKGDNGAAGAQSQASAPATQMSSPSSSQPSAPPAVSTTQAAPQPIHIHWQGPMRMVPTDLASAEPLADGKAIVGLVGSPVFVHQSATDNGQTTDLQCDNLRYHTEDSSAHLLGNVLLKQTRADGVVSTVSGSDLEFSRLKHFALFNGPGKTRFPDPGDPKSVLKADWHKRCFVGFYDLAGAQTQIQHADLEGNVVVEHPRFRLSARENVQLHFDDPVKAGNAQSGSPPLRSLIASGDADCIVHEANNQDRRISGQTLKLLRDPGPDGKLYAHQILCFGSVRAVQDNQQLTADQLQIDLLPTTRKSSSGDELAGEVALHRLQASNNVVVTGKDDSTAEADQLEVIMVDDQPHVKLLGSADRAALVKNKTSTLTGWNIQFAPHDQTALIDGPGTYDGLQQPQNSSEKPRPLKLSWQQSASLDGNKNLVLISGDVHARSDDGLTSQSAACNRVVATLADVAPTTQPATRPANGEAIADGADFMKNKQIKLLSLQMEPSADAGNQPTAQVESDAYDAGGFLLHRYDLLSRKIDFDPVAKRLSVNGPGGILAVEQSPPSTQPATEPSESTSAIGGSGNTAIGWKRRFIYDDAAHSATIEGDIKIVHQGTGPKAQSVTLEHADVVQADFYSDATTKPTVADRTAPPKLKQLTATGPMTIVTADKTITCGEMDFDPIEQILTCRHGQLAKVTVVDDNDLSGATCDEASLNIKTNELKKLTNVTGQGR